MTGSATITTIRFPVLLILPGNKLPACQGRRQAFGVLFTASDTAGLWAVGQDTHALLLASHRSRLGVHSTSVPAAPGGVRGTTGAVDLEPGVPGASWFTRLTRPLSPGEVTSLPKPSVLPGPLDGSQELLVRGSRGLVVGGWLLTCGCHNKAPPIGQLKSICPSIWKTSLEFRESKGPSSPQKL